MLYGAALWEMRGLWDTRNKKRKRNCLSRVRAFFANIRSTFRSNDPSVASLNVTGLWPFWWNTFGMCTYGVYCTNVSIQISRQWNSSTLRRLIKGSCVRSEMFRRWISGFWMKWKHYGPPALGDDTSKEITMLFLFSSIYLWMVMHLLMVGDVVAHRTSPFRRKI